MHREEGIRSKVEVRVEDKAEVGTRTESGPGCNHVSTDQERQLKP